MNSLKARLEAFQRSRAGLFTKKVLDDQVPNLGALLAWGTLSTMLPLLLGTLSIAGLVLRDQQRLDQVYNALGSALPASAAGPVTDVLDGMRQGSAAPAGVIAIVLLLISGSSFFTNMASVFDQAYHVQGRNVIVERLVGFGMLVLTATLLVVSTLAAGLSGLVSNVPGAMPIGPVAATATGWCVAIVSVFVLFLLLYRVLPNGKQTWASVVPGAVASSVLIFAISQVFPLYVALFPPNHAYAVFGVFLVLTFWLYLLGIVLVLGAELNAFLEQPTRSVALAEATAAAQRGQAAFDQETAGVTAEASGAAASMRGGGPLGAPSHSTGARAAAEPYKTPARGDASAGAGRAAADAGAGHAAADAGARHAAADAGARHAAADAGARHAAADAGAGHAAADVGARHAAADAGAGHAAADAGARHAAADAGAGHAAADAGARHAAADAGARAERQPRVGLGGRLIGLVGLLGAALLLRRGQGTAGGQSARV
jgi:membrane protein